MLDGKSAKQVEDGHPRWRYSYVHLICGHDRTHIDHSPCKQEEKEGEEFYRLTWRPQHVSPAHEAYGFAKGGDLVGDLQGKLTLLRHDEKTVSLMDDSPALTFFVDLPVPTEALTRVFATDVNVWAAGLVDQATRAQIIERKAPTEVLVKVNGDQWKLITRVGLMQASASSPNSFAELQREITFGNPEHSLPTFVKITLHGVIRGRAARLHWENAAATNATPLDLQFDDWHLKEIAYEQHFPHASGTALVTTQRFNPPPESECFFQRDGVAQRVFADADDPFAVSVPEGYIVNDLTGGQEGAEALLESDSATASSASPVSRLLIVGVTAVALVGAVLLLRKIFASR